jgi:hypothetical protein
MEIGQLKAKPESSGHNNELCFSLNPVAVRSQKRLNVLQRQLNAAVCQSKMAKIKHAALS